VGTQEDLLEARSEASALLALGSGDLQRFFFDETMRRNLSRTIRHLDRLVRAGGEDRELGRAALQRLGFSAEG
jgi:hypothetical protein